MLWKGGGLSSLVLRGRGEGGGRREEEAIGRKRLRGRDKGGTK
jgi:hypothetical protein